MSSRKDNWVAGINAVASALEHDLEHVREVLLEAGSKNPRITEIEETARRRDVSVRRVPLQSLEGIAGGLRHQGAVARYEAAKATDEKELPGLVEAAAGKALVLILDGVQDPHNLGACLRSASAGAADRIPVVSVTNLARTMRALQEMGVWLYGLDGEAKASIHATDFTGNVGLVMGGEGEGMRRLTRETCDGLVRIPMPGEMESLNVSVATGVALFEVVRQRRASK